MHHAPAGPPLSARVAAFLARLRFRAAGLLGALTTLVIVVRRTRVVPLALTALALGAFAVSAPLTPYDDAPSTAALSGPDVGRGLLPATGDGWTQDGEPSVPSRDRGSVSSSSASSASAASSASSPGSASTASSPGSPSGPATAAEEPAGDGAPVHATGSSEGPASPSSSGGTSSSASGSGASTEPPSSSSARSSTSAPDAPESPSAAPSETPEVATTAADPAGEVLAAVNSARVTAGCPALTADAGLASLAAGHSAAMRDGGFVSVRSPDGGSPLDRGSRTVVVAAGTDPAAVAAGWQGEDDLLDCRLGTAGVGTTDGFWTLVAA